MEWDELREEVRGLKRSAAKQLLAQVEHFVRYATASLLRR